MSGVLRWEDPPPVDTAPRPQRPWSLIAQQLRDRPGEWGVVLDSGRTTSVGAAIRTGRSAWFRPVGAFEAVERMQADGKVALYARYVGEPT